MAIPTDGYASSDDESYELIGGSPSPSVTVSSIVEKTKEEEASVDPTPPIALKPVRRRVAKAKKEEETEEKRKEEKVDVTGGIEVAPADELQKKTKEQQQLSQSELAVDLLCLFIIGCGCFALGYLVVSTATQFLITSSRPSAAPEDLPRQSNLIRENWNLPSPCAVPINGFPLGQRIRLVGMAKPNATRFSFDLEGQGTDIGFHFNPRFYQSRVVRNSAVKGEWNFDKEQIHGYFPFKMDEIFTVEFISTRSVKGEAMVKVLINGKEFTNFLERSPSFIDSDFLTIRGDVAIHSMQMFKN